MQWSQFLKITYFSVRRVTAIFHLWLFADVRVEDFVYSKLDKPLRERASNFETLGAVMIDAGHDLGPTTPYGLKLSYYMTSYNLFTQPWLLFDLCLGQTIVEA